VSLSVNQTDDPEYHWTDSFRTPRTSNEARTRVMYRLAGHLRRAIGRKCQELGGIAVLGFSQTFHIEPIDHVLSVRAVGTAVGIIPSGMTVPRGIKGIVTLDRDFPPHSRIGGFLSAASVKILDGDKDGGKDREAWWNELAFYCFLIR
jgi:hypothetical protein